MSDHGGIGVQELIAALERCVEKVEHLRPHLVGCIELRPGGVQLELTAREPVTQNLRRIQYIVPWFDLTHARIGPDAVLDEALERQIYALGVRR